MDFERAVEIAAIAHSGQLDKVGETYLLHPVRVALSVSPEARVVAVLHDVVEDSEDFSLETLRDEGLSDEECAAIELVTKRPEEEDDYGAFIDRIASATGPGAELARAVKLADVRDNFGRLPDSDEPDWARRRRQYEYALERLGG